MMILGRLWKQLSYLGIHEDYPEWRQKKMLLTNRIAGLLLLVVLCTYAMHVYFYSLELQLTALLCTLLVTGAPLLNIRGHDKAARILLSTTLSVAFVLPPLFTGNFGPGNVLSASYALVSFSPLPLLLLDPYQDKRWLWGALALHFALLLSFEPLLLWRVPQLNIGILQEHYALYKVPQLLLWFIVVVSLRFLRNANTLVEQEIRFKNLELGEQQGHIIRQTDEIQRKNQALQEANQAISLQNTELLVSQGQLEQQKREIQEKKEQLLKGERRIAKFLEKIPAGVLVFNGNGSIAYNNQQARHLLGAELMNSFGSGQWQGPRQVLQAYTDKGYPQEAMPVYKALQGQVSTVDDLVLLHEGGRVPLSVNAAPIFDFRGRVEYAITIVEDISQRKKQEREIRLKNAALMAREEDLNQSLTQLKATQDALAMKEAETRSLLEAITQNFIVLEYAPSGRLLDLNQKALNYFALPRQEMLDMSHEQLDSKAHNAHPQLAEEYRQFWDALLAGEPQHRELKVSYRQLNLWLRSTYVPILDNQGQVVKIMALGQDITPLIHQQREIENMNSLLEEKVEYIESQNLILQQHREEIGEQNNVLQEHQEMLSQHLSQLQEAHNQLKDTQSQLVQSEKMAALGQLTAGIAHELNNPINYINSGIDGLQGAVDSILKVYDAYEEASQHYGNGSAEKIATLKQRLRMDKMVGLIKKMPENIGIGARRAAEIVKELRTFSRVNEDDLKLSDVHEGLDSTLILLNNQYKKEITIHKHYGPLPLVECYPGKLNQVFMNLLTNAIFALKEKYRNLPGPAQQQAGHIDLITRVEEREGAPWAQVIIKDNGPGIAPEVQRRIFEPFFTTKEVGQGTGLGLSISASIIQDHNGALSVTSDPGEGATFTVSLPIKQTKSEKHK